MIEVPCLLFELDALMKKVDFVSVGSNDLMQFMYRRRPHQRARRQPLRCAVAGAAARTEDAGQGGGEAQACR